MNRILILLTTFAAISLAQTSPITGKWTYTMMESSQGPPITMDLKVDGTKVTGMVTLGDRKFAIESGTATADSVKFTIKRERPQGGTAVYEMSGKVSGDSMKGSTVAKMDSGEMNQDWEAKRQ